MRILVLGGSGFIGSHVVRRALGNGHEVLVFHRAQSGGKPPPAASVLVGDRRAIEDHAAEFAAFAPDVAIDMIAYTEEDAVRAARVLEGVAGRAVVVSSMDVYRNYERLRGAGSGPPDPTPLTEEAPLREELHPYRDLADGPDDRRYGYDKIPVERAYRESPTLGATVLRLPAVHGPGDPSRRLAPYLRRMDDGRAAILLDEGRAAWRWSRGYVENVANAIAIAATDERARGRVYNVGEERAETEAEWVRRIGRVRRWNGEVVPTPRELLPEALRKDRDWECHVATETSRIRVELGYEEAVSLDEGIRRTIAWDRRNPGEREELDYAAEDAALESLSASR